MGETLQHVIILLKVLMIMLIIEFELRIAMHYEWWSTIFFKFFIMVFNNSSLFMSMSNLI